jgi:hypothetical protein
VSSMIDRNKYANLAEALADVTDIDKVVLAVAREVAIREMVAETGETREAVTTVADAAVSMDEEAVLDLMDGEPTTLGRALALYIDELEKRDELQPRDRIVGELDMLIRYPWPGAVPAEQEWANFRNDVAVTLRRKIDTSLYSQAVEDSVADEVVALVKDRFFPDR